MVSQEGAQPTGEEAKQIGCFGVRTTAKLVFFSVKNSDRNYFFCLIYMYFIVWSVIRSRLRYMVRYFAWGALGRRDLRYSARARRYTLFFLKSNWIDLNKLASLHDQ